MFFQEKKAIVYLTATILLSLGYYAYLYHAYQAAEWQQTSQEIRFWAQAILLFVPVQVVGKVIIHVLFVMVNALATQEQEPTFMDELDQRVELKATRNFYHIFMAGFMAALGTQALAMSITWLFVTLLAGILAASLTFDLSQLYYYRRGG